MSKVQRGALIIVSLLTVLLSGCAPESGLSQTGLVVALAVDPAGSQGFRWTFMFPNPTITPGNEISVKPARAYFTLQTVAPSLPRAIQDIATVNDRQVYVGDVQVVVFNHRVGAGAINTLIASMINMGSFPTRAWLALSGNSAEATLKTTMPEETVPTVYLSSYFNCRVCHPIRTRIRLWQAWDALHLPSHTAVLPWITRRHGHLSLAMSGWVTLQHIVPCDPAQTESWAIAMGRYQNGSLAFHHLSRLFVAQHIDSSVHHTVLDSHHHLSIQWNVLLKGRWQWTPLNSNASNTLLARYTLHEILNLVHKAVKARADPFGIITQVNWHNQTAQIPPIEVYVRCDVVPTGRSAYDTGTPR